MKATWRIIVRISLVLVALGLICGLVGIFTGGSIARVQNALNTGYDFNSYVDIGKQFFADATKTAQGLYQQVLGLIH